jgi:hypothetical protein
LQYYKIGICNKDPVWGLFNHSWIVWGLFNHSLTVWGLFNHSWTWLFLTGWRLFHSLPAVGSRPVRPGRYMGHGFGGRRVSQLPAVLPGIEPDGDSQEVGGQAATPTCLSCSCCSGSAASTSCSLAGIQARSACCCCTTVSTGLQCTSGHIRRWSCASSNCLSPLQGKSLEDCTLLLTCHHYLPPSSKSTYAKICLTT